MQTTVIQTIGSRECPFTYRGTNLADLRRAEIYRLCDSFGIANAEMSKNDLLILLMAHLKSVHADPEITDLLSDGRQNPV